MSWLFGVWSHHGSSIDEANVSACHRDRLLQLHRGSLYIAAGGLPETCLWESSPDGTSGWLVVGLGLIQRAAHYDILSRSQWQQVMHAASIADEVTKLDGHFVALRWQPAGLEIATDQLGVRRLYYTNSATVFTFSTRLAWLTQKTGKKTLDVEALGAHWLVFNPLTNRSLVEGVACTGQGSVVQVRAEGGYTIRDRPWTPCEVSPHEAPAVLATQLTYLMQPVSPWARTVSLGLSGGLDSRLLLALMMAGASGQVGQLHVFGEDNDPDVRTSKRMAQKLGLSNTHMHRVYTSADEVLCLITEHVAQTCATIPATAALKLAHYGSLQAKKRIMVDGGFGEIGRMQFLNRLRKRGRAVLMEEKWGHIVPFLQVHRADIFNTDVVEAMKNGLVEDAHAVGEQMPRIDRVGVDGWLDLLSVRIRLPHFFGYEQARLDEVVPNYMPYAQPSVLSHVLALEPRLRKNGRLYKRTIAQHAPLLTTIPLVKGNATYPFGWSTLAGLLWVKSKQRLGMCYHDATRITYLDLLREYIHDIVQSQETRTYALYDRAKVDAIVQRYYAGDKTVAAALDWWLSFELWRRSIEG